MNLSYILLILSFGQIIAKKVILKNRDGPIEIIVSTDKGRVRGVAGQTVDEGKSYIAFKGIPFAQPPLGSLRFEPPIPANSWNEILNATQDRSECVQETDSVEGSEDCLYINVYTPKLPTQSENATLLSVMVWIYGGTFLVGNSSYHLYGPDYFLDQDVVFVSFNYRLGIFGFLSTGDLVAPGNNGLKDQVLALKWVKNNIARFGGDPKKVTIFGESAGAASVSYLLQSNLTEGLFRSAIMESATSLCLWSLSRRAKRAAFATGTILQVNTTNSESLVNGLKNVSYVQLQTVSNLVYNIIFLENSRIGLIFAPVSEPNHENAFYTGKSHALLNDGHFHRVPLIIGFNSLEGKNTLDPLMSLFLTKYDLNVSSLVPIDMNINSSSVLNTVGLSIHERYWGNTPIALSPQINTKIFVSDDQYNRPIRESVRIQTAYVPVYFYLFSYEGILGGSANSEERGVAHAEELYYLFPSDRPATAGDILARKRFVRLWTNFAKYSNPTPEREPFFQNVTWPVAGTSGNNSNLRYLDFGYRLQVRVNPFAENLRYWNNLYARYGHPEYDTY